ncbi:MAG: Holliday junction resolvase RuvX [bacterium]
MQNTDLINKRLAGIDYGKKRIGLAFCNELQISVNSKYTIDNDSQVWDKLLKFFSEERIQAVVVGFPATLDGSKTEFHTEIESFIEIIKEKYKLPVYIQDEYKTSVYSVDLMISSGYGKKKRSKKGAKDKIAAALILQSFIEEN